MARTVCRGSLRDCVLMAARVVYGDGVEDVIVEDLFPGNEESRWLREPERFEAEARLASAPPHITAEATVVEIVPRPPRSAVDEGARGLEELLALAAERLGEAASTIIETFNRVSELGRAMRSVLRGIVCGRVDAGPISITPWSLKIALGEAMVPLPEGVYTVLDPGISREIEGLDPSAAPPGADMVIVAVRRFATALRSFVNPLARRGVVAMVRGGHYGRLALCAYMRLSPSVGSASAGMLIAVRTLTAIITESGNGKLLVDLVPAYSTIRLTNEVAEALISSGVRELVESGALPPVEPAEARKMARGLAERVRKLCTEWLYASMQLLTILKLAEEAEPSTA